MAPELKPDWRVGRRVAVKWRADPRYGLHGVCVGASDTIIVVRTADGQEIVDDADNWRTA